MAVYLDWYPGQPMDADLFGICLASRYLLEASVNAANLWLDPVARQGHDVRLCGI